MLCVCVCGGGRGKEVRRWRVGRVLVRGVFKAFYWCFLGSYEVFGGGMDRSTDLGM